MKGHTTADQYGAQKFGFISSTIVVVTVVSNIATASCFGVDIFRLLYRCSNMLRYVSAGEKIEHHKHLASLCFILVICHKRNQQQSRHEAIVAWFAFQQDF